MGRVQSWDNSWDLGAMSVYNTITSLAESPLQAGLLYAGTDDGIIQISEDDGANWTRVEVGSIQGIPATAFVNNLYADVHDVNVVYAALDNHKYGDLNPYLIKSTNKGRSWESIAGNLPERTLVWRVAQDHVNPDLLFAATEFGIYFTVDGGTEWVKIKSDATISFRDITIQRRENDLVAASFGRGFFILDDYSPLREVNAALLAQEAHLFPARKAYLYRPRDVAGGSQGTSYYAAPNPDFGATFTYYLKEGSTTLKEERKKREEAAGEGDIAFPGWEALEAERNEVTDVVEIVVRDASGNVANRVKGETSKGFHRVSWNLRYASKGLIEPGEESNNDGFLATPGTYTATLIKTANGGVSELAGPISFEVVLLHEPTLQGASPDETIAFRKEMEAFQGQMAAFSNLMEAQMNKVEAMQTALARADRPSNDLVTRLREARQTLQALDVKVRGYRSKSEIGERNPPSPQSRMFAGFRGLNTTYGPTEMHKTMVAIGKAEMAEVQAELNQFVNTVMPELEAALQTAGAPPIEGQ